MDYSVLIVDDEELIRKGLIARLEYLDIHPKAIYQADSGEEAIRLFRELKPDIVVADILMADMDGLEFIKKAKELKLPTEFIILSGHADFWFAEKAIEMGVSAYLLKPLSNEKLAAAFRDAEKALTDKQELRNALIEKGRVKRENDVLSVERELNTLFHTIEPDEEMSSRSHIDSLFHDQKHYLTAIVNIDGITYDINYAYKDIELLKFSIVNVFNEIDIDAEKCIVYNLANANQMIVILAGQNPKKLRKDSQYFFSRLISAMDSLMNMSLTIGAAGIHPYISKKSYDEAHDALCMRMYHNVGSLYEYEDAKTLASDTFPAVQIEILGSYMERGDIDNILILLNDILSRERMRQFGPDYIRIIWMRILNLLMKISGNNPYEDFGRLEKSVLNFQIIDNFNDIEDLIQYLYTMIMDFIKPGSLGDMKCRNKIKLATQYIEENYNTELVINDLAYKFAMSPNYFSSLFKKEKHTTVVNYIKSLRLKKSCELLKMSNLSVAEIAQAVGYIDSQYFFRIFKKEMGMTPLQYRNNAPFSDKI